MSDSIKKSDGSLPRSGRTGSASKNPLDGTPNRLPSLRGPRDLTLGGIKKKTFAPTIPVRKDRVKVETKPESSATPRGRPGRDKNARENRQRGRGRGRGFRQKEVIQSHSIFESGPSSDMGKKGRDPHGSFSEPGASAQIQRPTIKKEGNVDAALEKAESDKAMKRLEEGNNSLISDLNNDKEMQPTTLPMNCPEELTPLLKKEKSLQAMPTMKQHSDSSRCSHIFSDMDSQKLLLFQLPDALPGVTQSKEDTSRITVKQEAGSQPTKVDTKDPKNEQNENDRCNLSSLSEGKIGKLQILKSGKCRLLLGNVVLNLKMGVTPCFSEELVSVHLPPEDSPPDMKGHLSVLGNVSDRVICIPDMESLLKSTT